MTKTKSVFLLALFTLSNSSNVFANKVEFSPTDRDGTFHCVVDTITKHFKTVDIHTSGVEVNGFCSGQEYVLQPGHITGMSMSELNKFYFEYKKTPGKAGSVDIVATFAGDVTCFAGKGENKKLYGNGKYC